MWPRTPGGPRPLCGGPRPLWHHGRGPPGGPRPFCAVTVLHFRLFFGIWIFFVGKDFKYKLNVLTFAVEIGKKLFFIFLTLDDFLPKYFSCFLLFFSTLLLLTCTKTFNPYGSKVYRVPVLRCFRVSRACGYRVVVVGTYLQSHMHACKSMHIDT